MLFASSWLYIGTTVQWLNSIINISINFISCLLKKTFLEHSVIGIPYIHHKINKKHVIKFTPPSSVYILAYVYIYIYI